MKPILRKQILGKTIGRLWLLFIVILAVYIFKISNRIKLRGRRNLPKGTGTLYVSNHQTIIDSLLIGISVSSIFDIFVNYDRIPYNAPAYDNFYNQQFVRWLMNISKCIPAHRLTRKIEVIEQDVTNFREALKQSNLVLFYEGTRTRDGSLGECKYGVAKTISLARPKNVIPIYLHNVQPIMPIDSEFDFAKIYGGHRGEIYIGKAIVFTDYDNLASIKLEVKEAISKLEMEAKLK